MTKEGSLSIVVLNYVRYIYRSYVKMMTKGKSVRVRLF